MDEAAADDALLDVARLVVALSTRAADRMGQISVVQLRALTVLHDLETATLGELADGVGVTPSTTSRLVDRLVAGGWADRQVSEESRRQLALRLTPEGAATLAEYDRLRLEAMRECLARVPADRRDAVLHGLAEFAATGRPARGGSTVDEREEAAG